MATDGHRRTERHGMSVNRVSKATTVGAQLVKDFPIRAGIVFRSQHRA